MSQISINDMPNEIMQIIITIAYEIPRDKYNMMRVNRRFYDHASLLKPPSIGDKIFNDNIDALIWAHKALERQTDMAMIRHMNYIKNKHKISTPISVTIQNDSMAIGYICWTVIFNFGSDIMEVRSDSNTKVYTSKFGWLLRKFPSDNHIKFAEESGAYIRQLYKNNCLVATISNYSI
jgi:hypothetical protein